MCIIPQIESVKGVENADEIAAVPGVHALMFGPGDYLIDAGLDLTSALSGEPHPTFAAAMEKFGAAAQKNGLPIFGYVDVFVIGVMLANFSDSGAMSVDMVPMLIQQGFRAIAVQFDVWGLSKLIHGSLTQARAAAKQVASQTNGETEGETKEAKS